MAQVKIYGLKDHLTPRREALSRVIHAWSSKTQVDLLLGSVRVGGA